MKKSPAAPHILFFVRTRLATRINVGNKDHPADVRWAMRPFRRRKNSPETEKRKEEKRNGNRVSICINWNYLQYAISILAERRKKNYRVLTTLKFFSAWNFITGWFSHSPSPVLLSPIRVFGLRLRSFPFCFPFYTFGVLLSSWWHFFILRTFISLAVYRVAHL